MGDDRSSHQCRGVLREPIGPVGDRVGKDERVTPARPPVEVHVEIGTERVPAAQRDRIVAEPTFGDAFTDHMVTMRHAEGRWGSLELRPFAALSLSPATLALHYGQSVFEALKAYRRPDGGSPALFRPDRNGERLGASARRLAMPELQSGVFELACALLVAADRDWVPTAPGAALYVRPVMFAAEPHLAVRPANEYLFVVIASPVASYFGSDVRAITVGVETSDVRATAGGTGSVKFAGNYAAGFAAHGRAAAAHHDQVLWLDAAERRWVEELNAMNVVFVWDRGGRTVVTTPPATGTILEGVTRDSLLTLARDAVVASDGLVDEVVEEPTSIDDVVVALESGSLREVFACGTAAVVAPVGTLVHRGRALRVGGGSPGPVTMELRRRLLAIQHGGSADTNGWMVPVDGVLAGAGLDVTQLG